MTHASRRVLGVLLVYGLIGWTSQTAMAGRFHINNGGIVHCEYWDPPDSYLFSAVPSITEAWFFSSVGDQTISDPTRPPAVLGSSGPWDISLTNQDPLGGTQAYQGMHFVLQTGGTPADGSSVFIHPLVAVPGYTTSTVTEFWRDATDGIVSQTVTPIEVTQSFDTTGLTFPEGYQTIWDTYLVPEPAGLLMIGLLGAGLFGTRAVRPRHRP